MPRRERVEMHDAAREVDVVPLVAVSYSQQREQTYQSNFVQDLHHKYEQQPSWLVYCVHHLQHISAFLH